MTSSDFEKIKLQFLIAVSQNNMTNIKDLMERFTLPKRLINKFLD
jgi:hypothetical protein